MESSVKVCVAKPDILAYSNILLVISGYFDWKTHDRLTRKLIF